ncbi:MAG: hypothetical protein Kow00124_32080 [Anaerolineae bacterium]
MIPKNPIVANWHILAVDDEPDSLEVVGRVLAYHGARVSRAANGKEALAILQQMRPTLIISDLSMPQMDGWELIYTIQQDPRTADIPVVALTAHAMQGDRDRVMAVGFHGYLTKPLSPATFLDSLLALFSEDELAKLSMNTLPASSLAGITDKGNGAHHD